MSLDDLLLQHKKIVLRTWLDLLLSTYPPETERMFKKESDQFANPVGHTFTVALGEILDEFLHTNNPEKLAPLLDRIIRIRAVQEFSPSQALSFIFSLKRIAAKIHTEGGEDRRVRDDMSAFEAKVDELALLAFDVYTRCRENLFEVRMKELKDRTYRLLQRAEIIGDVPPQEPGEEKP
jgi:hypothetical protein